MIGSDYMNDNSIHAIFPHKNEIETLKSNIVKDPLYALPNIVYGPPEIAGKFTHASMVKSPVNKNAELAAKAK